MIIGYYEEIYCAQNINEEELFNFLKNLAIDDITENTDGDSIKSVETIILERIDNYVEFYILDCLSNIDLQKNRTLIFYQLKEFILNNIKRYI